MWPFRKKLNPMGRGYVTDPSSTPALDFTPDELKVINRKLKAFEGMFVLKGWEDRVKNITIAKALSEYADEQGFKAERESDSEARQRFLNNALSATLKACNVFPHPILDYDLACFSVLVGKKDAAIRLFRKFLSEYKPAEPNTIDSMLLQGRDIEKALRHAKEAFQSLG